MNATLADYLEVWGFEGDYIIFSDGSLGFGMELLPLDVSCWSNDRVNVLAEKLSHFLNSLPEGLDIQFIQEIRTGNEETVRQHEWLASKADNSAAKALCEERVKRFLELDQQGLMPFHGLKIFIRKSPVERFVAKAKLLSKQNKFQEVTQARLQRELQLVERVHESIFQSLDSIGCMPRNLSSDEIYREMYALWNPVRPISAPNYDPEDVRSSVVFSDVAISEKGFTMANCHHRVISLKLLPDQTYASMANILRNLPFDSRFHLSIHVPNQMKEVESLQTQRRLAFSMARGKTGVTDIDSEAKLQDLETLLEQMIAAGEKVFQISLNVVLRSKSENELEDQVEETLRVFREMSGAEGLEESIAAFPIFAEISIPNARSKERVKRLKTSNLCDLIPIYGPWRGFSKASVLLRTRQGSAFSFDPFSSDLANANQLVSGGSGSGKSFMTNLLLLQMLKENPKVYFVDIGGSYKKLCENLDGQYVPLGLDSGLAFNPFDLGPDETVPSPQKIKFLVGLIELMTKDEDASRLPKLERAEIEGAIAKVYEQNVSPRLNHLREILLRHADPEIQKYARILTPWCGNTPFGRFLDRETTIALNRPLVAFDLKNLESFPDLQAICLYVITDFVWREIQRDRSKMKFLVFDECWKLLKNEAGMSFIEEVFRTFRKYYASAIAISQDIDDFAKSKIAGAILPNCAIKWVLMQQQSDPIRIKEALDLNDNELNLIKSLRQEKGVYSEAFLITQKNRVLTVIESTALEYWIATTDPKDLAKIEEISQIENALDPVAVLKKLAELYPNGIAAHERKVA